MALAILRDVTDSGVRGLARSRTRDVGAVQLDVPGRRRPHAGQGLDSSLCPLPSTPAIATISPACTSIDSPRTASRPRSSRTQRSCTASILSPGCAAPRVTSSSTARPTISSARPPSVGACALQRRDLLAPTQDRDPVGDLEHLVQLVRDQDDRRPPRDQRAQDGEELVDLLRRQHGGRLVEDQHARIAVERLEDLDALLLTDPDLLDDRVRLDREAVARGDRSRTRTRAAARSSWPGAGARPRARCSRRPTSPGSA